VAERVKRRIERGNSRWYTESEPEEGRAGHGAYLYAVLAKNRKPVAGAEGEKFVALMRQGYTADILL
jgi:hypothetical protein